MPLPDAFAKIPGGSRDGGCPRIRAGHASRRAAPRSKRCCRRRSGRRRAPRRTSKVSYAGEPKFEPIPGTDVARAVNTRQRHDRVRRQATTCATTARGTSRRCADRTVGRHANGARCDLPDSAELAVVSGDAGHRAAGIDAARRSSISIRRHTAPASTSPTACRTTARAGTTRRTSTARTTTRTTAGRTATAAGTTRTPAATDRARSGTDLTVATAIARATTRTRAATVTSKPRGTATSGRARRELQPAHRHQHRDRPLLQRRLQQVEDGAHRRGPARQRNGREAQDGFRHGHEHDDARGRARWKFRDDAPAQSDGSITKSGTIETARRPNRQRSPASARTARLDDDHGSEGGGTGTVDRQRDADGSVSREGSFSKDGQTIDTETRRDGDRSVTKAEGSGGGQAISASGGIGDRTTIAESGSGDLYAGHDGDVYKKTDDGWQKRQDGGWQDVQTPERPNGGEGGGNFSRDQLGDRPAQTGVGDAPRYGGSGSLSGAGDGASASQRPEFSGGGMQARPANQDYGQLDRDAAARRGGNQSYQNRRSYQRPAGGMQRQPRAMPRRR